MKITFGDIKARLPFMKAMMPVEHRISERALLPGKQIDKVIVKNLSSLVLPRSKPINPKVFGRIPSSVVQMPNDAESQSFYAISSAGLIVHSSSEITHLQSGDRVVTVWQPDGLVREFLSLHHTRVVRIPPSVSCSEACLAGVGVSALEMIKNTGASLGETIILVGLDLFGLLALQLLKAGGCQVIGIDDDQRCLELALEFGVDLAVEKSSPTLSRDLKHFVGDLGVDRALILEGEGLASLLPQLGFLIKAGGEIFLSDKINSLAARRGWSERNIGIHYQAIATPEARMNSAPPSRDSTQFQSDISDIETFLRLAAEGKLKLMRLIGQNINLNSGVENPIEKEPRKTRSQTTRLAKVINFPAETQALTTVTLKQAIRPGVPSKKAIRIGLIGGEDLSAFLSPRMMSALSDQEGGLLYYPDDHLAIDLANDFGFKRATTDKSAVISDPEIDLVIVASLLGDRGADIIAALRKRKAVLSLAPLSLDNDELDLILKLSANSSSKLACLNQDRNLLRLTQIREEIKKSGLPAVFNCTASLSGTEDSADSNQVSERLSAELLSYIAEISLITGADVTAVLGYALPPTELMGIDRHRFQVTALLSDGSQANLAFTFDKERVRPLREIRIEAGRRSFACSAGRWEELLPDGKRNFLITSTDQAAPKSILEITSIFDEYNPESIQRSIQANRIVLRALESAQSGKLLSMRSSRS